MGFSVCGISGLGGLTGLVLFKRDKVFWQPSSNEAHVLPSRY